MVTIVCLSSFISLIIILICTVRIVSYGIYTIRDNNKTGGVGLFIMALATAASSVFFYN